MDAPPTSIALSSSGDFLCSAHVDDLGIYLWSNRTLYSHVPLRPLPADHTPSIARLPNTTVACEEEAEDETNSNLLTTGMTEETSTGHENETPEHPVAVPLADGLVTLSDLPKSRWHNLQQLDVIKQHNKPTEPPKRPKQAPFFLSTTAGLQPKFVAVAEEGVIPAVEGEGSKILNLGKLVPLSEFQSVLQQCAAVDQCKGVEKCWE